MEGPYREAADGPSPFHEQVARGIQAFIEGMVAAAAAAARPVQTLPAYFKPSPLESVNNIMRAVTGVTGIMFHCAPNPTDRTVEFTAYHGRGLLLRRSIDERDLLVRESSVLEHVALFVDEAIALKRCNELLEEVEA